MKKILLLITIIISISCNQNNKEEQKIIPKEIKKPKISYVIVAYDISYYELNNPLDIYPMRDLQLKTVMSDIQEVADLNDEKKAKLKDEFLVSIRGLLELKNKEYLENVAILESVNFHKAYNAPFKLKDKEINEFKNKKVKILDRTVKVFNTYKEASEFSFKFNKTTNDLNLY
jgi:hypothetical protein